jgi:uncharacterized damage-inducible protein DinB
MDLKSFLRHYKREHATTRKVLQALPADQSQFRPHDRSSTAHMLGWTFVVEERMIEKALKSDPVLGSGWPPAPVAWQDVLDAFDAAHHAVLEAADGVSEATMKPVAFFVGPKQTGDYQALDFAWFMLFDQIHHRGQFSVYLRMAGGKVPSIYGPSADEPWT